MSVVSRAPTRFLGSAVVSAMIVTTLSLGWSPAASAAAPPAPYFNGFENAGDAVSPPNGTDQQAMFDVTRVASGTDGITAASGGSFAEAATNDYSTGTLSQFTRLGGYSDAFPAGGFTTSIDIYLNMSVATGSNDLRFDWSSAINDPSGNHRRDFIFSVGTSTTAGQFVMSASNNAPGWPANPGRDPFTVSTSGWYTFQNNFYDSGGGVLADQMSVLDAAHDVLHTWTLSDPSDIIGSTVGGNRYGWLVDNGFPMLALDNLARWSGAGSLGALGACPVLVSGSSPTVYTLLADCTTDRTIVVPQKPGGSVFDGNGYSITGVDPAGGHFLGAVVQAAPGAAPITVSDLTVTVSNLADVCDPASPDTRLRGILFDGVSGEIKDNAVTDIEQGANGQSGCQEGIGIDVRNSSEVTPNPQVTISGNDVIDYQKNGIVATGPVTAVITGNTVTGDGPVDYIAQNGIQISFGATATVRGDTVSGNAYTPSTYVACGLLLYQANGVKTGMNSLFDNERDLCNAGRGGGNVSPS